MNTRFTHQPARSAAPEGASDERGAGLVEYALLVALIAVVCIAAVTFLGTGASTKTDKAGKAVSGEVDPPEMTCPPGWHIVQEGVATVCKP